MTNPHFTVEDIIVKLLGDIKPIGETNYDKECLKNIQEWGEFYYWMTERFLAVATTDLKYLHSVGECSKEAGRYCQYVLEMLQEAFKNNDSDVMEE